MEPLFTLDNLVTLCLLTLLQAVLGFDNLLYITLESKRAPEQQRARVRKLGIAIAMVLRIVLLLLLMKLIEHFQNPWFHLDYAGAVEGHFNLHSVIVLAGGVLIIYTAMKEIAHMMGLEEIQHEARKPKSMGRVITMIVLMNLVFSFDSILSAMALTDNFWVMSCAIIVGAGLMIWLSDRVARFLQKNRMYEVLGLFILFVVGIMLLSEGGHLAHLRLLGHAITPMSKATFYFVITVLVLTDVAQTRYHKKLNRLKEQATKQLEEEAT